MTMNYNPVFERIAQLFQDQVKSGKQSQNIDNLMSCGQFISKQDLSQRGLHGVAAAIFVLSHNQNYADLTSKLCEYCQNINKYAPDKIESDNNNTIKQSELLFALCFVKAGTRDVSEMKSAIANNLLNAIYNGQGWDYFLKDTREIQLLSTAYALKGLVKAGYFNKVDSVFRHFRGELKEKSQHVDNPTRLSIYVLCLYVLVFYDEQYEQNEANYKTIFKNLIKSKYFSLSHSYEQNLEYHGCNDNHYVRIPWQLYYLALSSKLSKWEFLDRNAQKQLKEIREKVLNGGYRYEFSGEYISSRTYSIIFECLGKVASNTPHSNLVKLSKLFNTTKPYFIYLLWVIVVLLMIFSVYKWVINSFNVSDLAPEFIGYVLVIILTIRSRK